MRNMKLIPNKNIGAEALMEALVTADNLDRAKAAVAISKKQNSSLMEKKPRLLKYGCIPFLMRLRIFL